MTKIFYSGNYYLKISNESPMSDDGNTYCVFDLIKDKNHPMGCPVDQFGTIEEIIGVLKGWQEIDKRPEFECLREINASQIQMQKDFIKILETELNINCES